MIKRNIQNLVDFSKLAPYETSEPRYLFEANHAGLFTRVIIGLRSFLAGRSAKQALEAEKSKAIEHLHGLTDEQLRDIGITRMDISRAVRLGRDNI